MSQNDNRALAKLAGKAVLSAVKSLFASGIGGEVHLESGRDIKLEADRFLSDYITGLLVRNTGIACINEEGVNDLELPESGERWIVDPLDGSMNFTRGIPLYCISVALWKDGKPVVGIVYDLERKNMFSACDDIAKLDRKPMAVRREYELGKAVLATGFPLLSDTSSESVYWFLRFADKFKKVRMLGSAALSLAWVADGRLDAYCERDIMIWDVAAGLALVKGSGGVYYLRPGNHSLSFDVLAANAPLAQAMRKEME